MHLRRRQFLVQGAATAASLSLGSARAVADSLGQRGIQSPLAAAATIWCPGAVPQPILTGPAAGISSSTRTQDPSDNVDYHCIFAREFHLSAIPEQAVLRIFAFTRYRFYVNGQYVGRGPYRYQNHRPEFDSRDLHSLLRVGNNLLVVLVHRDAPTGRIMSHSPGFIATLEWILDGRRSVIKTDSSWLSTPDLSFGPRAQAWSSIEEHIDARKVDDWTRPDLSAPIWRPSQVVSFNAQLRYFQCAEPLQIEHALSWSSSAPSFPLEIHAGDSIEFSLEGIAQAYHLLEIDASEGSALQVSYRLPQGEESGTCTYIARDGIQCWMGGDTFAFRTLRITLSSGRVRLKRAQAFEVRYPFQRAGSFACSDPLLTRLWGICARSLEILSEDAYVDCADRERVEWIDNSPPAFDCTRVMMRGPDDREKTYWADARLLRGLLRRDTLTQQPDGQLKAHTCSERFDIHAIMEDRSCDWVVLLRQYVESTGDTDLVRELWPALTRLLAWYKQRLTPRGLVLAREWEVWDNPLRYQICEGAGLNAMAFRAIADAAQLAKNIGLVTQARALDQDANQLRAAFHRLLWNDREGVYDGALFGPGSAVRPQLGRPFTGTIVNGRFGPTAPANLFALYCGIVPEEYVGSVRAWILDHLDQVKETMSHYYLFHMLYAMNSQESDHQALNILRSKWRDQVDSEWQTTWENLEGDGSKIHIYGMHPAWFLSSYVLGVRREEPLARRTLLINPRFADLEWARGVCITEFGPVEIDWQNRGAEGLKVACNIPREVRATFRLYSQKTQESLRINGHAVVANGSNGMIEIALSPGRNVIKLLRSTDQ